MLLFETFYLPAGMEFAFNLGAGCGACVAKGGAFVFLTKHKEKDMRELSTEELEVVVGGRPIIIKD